MQWSPLEGDDTEGVPYLLQILTQTHKVYPCTAALIRVVGEEPATITVVLTATAVVAVCGRCGIQPGRSSVRSTA